MTNYWLVTHHMDVGYKKNPSGSRMLNPDYLDLPPDKMVPMLYSPNAVTIVVAGGTGDAWAWGSAGHNTAPKLISIDKWR